ncbi:flavin reductase family protein [Agromyces sp. SYSU T00194]|uniref:flavin reductase family protein n=1 Tax=Agromyces chitinivorans TaxID=3158560 RepID=UPI003392490E
MSELDLALSPRHPLASPPGAGATATRVDDLGLQAVVRALLAEPAHPVAVLTGRDDSGISWGLTVTSFTVVSPRPPLVVVSVPAAARSWSRIRPTGGFVLNLLADDQPEAAAAYAGPGATVARGHGVRYTIEGMPVLPGTLGALRCATTTVIRGGEHDVVLARVEAGRHDRTDAPLAAHALHAAPEPVGVR